MFQVAARLTVPCPITKSRTLNFADRVRGLVFALA